MTEYESASYQHAVQQTEHLAAIRWHLRGVTAVIVFAFAIWILWVLLSALH